MVRKRPTLVCVSANPALDRRLRVHRLTIGQVNRAKVALTLPGGKAAHVAMTVQALGARAVWLGFLGGSTGAECAVGLERLGIEVAAVRTKSATRVNLEAIEDSGGVTEVLEPGGKIERAEQTAMLSIFDKRLKREWQGAIVVISGSLPPGLPARFYRSLIELAHSAGSKVFLDTSGEALREGIGATPQFVKPNASETGALLGRKISGAREAEKAARKLIGLGAGSAAITLGSDGFVWIPSAGGECWSATPPRLKTISTVGAGDATMAGFAYAASVGMTLQDTARLAGACGAAMCVTELSATISEKDIRRLLPKIKVRAVKP